MKYEISISYMWVWTSGEPMVILYSMDSEGKMTFHSIKPASAYTG